jgi:hypothetical protein
LEACKQLYRIADFRYPLQRNPPSWRCSSAYAISFFAAALQVQACDESPYFEGQPETCWAASHVTEQQRHMTVHLLHTTVLLLESFG